MHVAVAKSYVAAADHYVEIAAPFFLSKPAVQHLFINPHAFSLKPNRLSPDCCNCCNKWAQLRSLAK